MRGKKCLNLMDVSEVKEKLLHIQSHTSSCPSSVQGGSSDSLHHCQSIVFEKKKENRSEIR